MFPFPPTPQVPTPGSRPDGDGSAQGRGKIILLGAALLFVTGVLVTSNIVLRGESAPPAPAPGTTPGGGTEVLIAPVPLFPEEEGEEVARILREKLEAFPSILDGIPAPDAGPYELLLREATVNARVLNLQPDGYEDDPDWARMLEGPAAFRGDPIAASGELLRLERIPWDRKDALFREVRRGTLRDGKGRLFTFSWPVGTATEEDPVPAGRGEWVRVHGLFYKPWVVEDGAKKEPSLHLVLARRPLKAFPAVAVRDIDNAWRSQVRDGTLVERTVVDEDPLFLLLNLSKTLGPDGWEGWLRAKQEQAPGARIFPPEDLTGKYAALLENPDAYRFRPVQYSAFLAKPSEIPPEWVRPNPGNIDRFWVGYLVDRDFVPAVWVFSPRSFADQGLRSDDYVTVEGFFLKRMAYVPAGWKPETGEESPRMMQAAVLVATRITKNELPKHSFASDILIAIVVLMLVMAGGLVWTILQGRRDEARFEAKRRQRIEARRAARAAEATREGAPPSPAGPAAPDAP